FAGPPPGVSPPRGVRPPRGLFSPPTNPIFAPPAGERPPLLVKCHGGPTPSASSALDLRVQYWTSRGIAVFDVNYGGSTRHGREDRDRPPPPWGGVDGARLRHSAALLADPSPRPRPAA